MLLTNQAINYRNAVLVFIGILLLAGISSYITIPREGTPDITIPYVFISAPYEGVAPEEIENLIVIPMERQLRDLENVKEMTATAAEGVGTIIIEFTPEEDINNALQRTRDKISLARRDLPGDLDEPVVEAFNFSTDFPVLIFTISGSRDLQRLKRLAEDLQDLIEDMPGVKQVAIGGVREREIRVEIDMFRLAGQRLTMGRLLNRIAEENRTVSAGNLEMQNNNLQLRVPGEYDLAADLSDIVLEVRDGAPVYLRDVARVHDTFKDLESISRINGEPGVSLHVKKRSGENTVSLIRRIRDALATHNLPADIKLTVIRDQSDIIRMMLEELENNIFAGVVLVFLVLMAVMGKRNSLFVAMAIPLSMLMAFVILDMLGVTLNMIVLFSLVISVGMLVDNGIVIVENIFRHYSQGLSRSEAARRGAGEVAWPVITSTMTTLVAFAPLLFWPGIIGQFMSFLPITLIVTLTSSLLVAIVFNPAVCSLLITRDKKSVKSLPDAPTPFLDRYEKILRVALENRGRIMFLSLLMLVITIQNFSLFNRGVELFPSTEPRSATITLKFPQGTRIEKTDTAMQTIEQTLADYPEIQFFLTTIGSAGGSILEGGGAINIGQIRVEFPPANERTRSSMEVTDAIRAALHAPPGAELKIELEKEGPPSGAPVSIEIAGDDFEMLAEIAGRITRAIENVPGLVDIQDDFEEALPEIQFVVARHRAALLGMHTAGIGHFLRTAVYGTTASKFRAGEDEYDITVRLREDQRQSTDILKQIFIPQPDGNSVPLSALGTADYTGGRGVITRKNRKRVITISGELQQRSIDAVLQDIQDQLVGISLPPGYAITYTGENRDMNEAGAFLSKAFLLTIGLIFVILVIQFNSALTPLIILAAVVLSMIGVMWGLLLCGLRFSIIMTGLGIISLAGVVVNNAIVLVDCIHQRLMENMPVREAVVTAGRMRFRPVLLTATTTILGLLPMAVGYSVNIHSWPWKVVAGAESSQWWAPMAVAIIFGLGVATIMTLIIVPVMFSLAHGIVSWTMRKYRGQEPGQNRQNPVV